MGLMDGSAGAWADEGRQTANEQNTVSACAGPNNKRIVRRTRLVDGRTGLAARRGAAQTTERVAQGGRGRASLEERLVVSESGGPTCETAPVEHGRQVGAGSAVRTTAGAQLKTKLSCWGVRHTCCLHDWSAAQHNRAEMG
jgi:hypothetical protein